MKICLNMIVRNEEAVIERCLRSVLPFIDYWCIVDTGSTDRTKNMILDILNHKPGRLIDHPWVNFGVNRTQAVAEAQRTKLVTAPAGGRFVATRDNDIVSTVGMKSDFILFMDADDQFVGADMFNPYRLDVRKSHFVKMLLGETEYRRMLIVPNTVQWAWAGVVHEYPVPETPIEAAEGTVPDLVVKAGVEGARSRDPEKYMKDAEMLIDELAKDPTNARNQFYLAQSLSHAGKYKEALNAYQRRTVMGGFEEEAWYSQYQEGMMTLHLENVKAAAELSFRAALNRRPWRAEPALALARYYRVERKDYASAYAYATLAFTTDYPKNDVLFVAKSVYEWGALDELCIAAYWLGRKNECQEGCLQLLHPASKLPASERERVKSNLMHCF